MAQPIPPVEGNALAGVLVTSSETPDRLARFRALGPQESAAVLDASLASLFGTLDPPAAEGTVLKILGYVPQVTRNEAPNARTGTACLQSGKSYCTGMALVMTALCRRAGLPRGSIVCTTSVSCKATTPSRSTTTARGTSLIPHMACSSTRGRRTTAGAGSLRCVSLWYTASSATMRSR
ncbi:MAG: transglutaminase domain-containing protein [Candidatus Competibacteraceae bacterium]|nr:transglutaminase domain-containing protein [Candidatus Competibacteraceae bacterium]